MLYILHYVALEEKVSVVTGILTLSKIIRSVFEDDEGNLAINMGRGWNAVCKFVIKGPMPNYFILF